MSSPFDRVDCKLLWGVDKALLEDFTISSIQPTDFDVVLVRENIGEVKVASDPVNCNTSDPIRTDSITNDVL